MALLFPVIGVYGSFYNLLYAIVEVAEEVNTSALLEFLDGYIVVLALLVVGRPDAEGTIGRKPTVPYRSIWARCRGNEGCLLACPLSRQSR